MAYKISLLTQKYEIHQYSLISFLTLKTASTEKMFPYEISREKVEFFENIIRFLLASALLAKCFPKVL